MQDEASATLSKLIYFPASSELLFMVHLFCTTTASSSTRIDRCMSARSIVSTVCSVVKISVFEYRSCPLFVAFEYYLFASILHSRTLQSILRGLENEVSSFYFVQICGNDS